MACVSENVGTVQGRIKEQLLTVRCGARRLTAPAGKTYSASRFCFNAASSSSERGDMTRGPMPFLRVPPWCCLYLTALWFFHPASALQLQDGMPPFHILAFSF
ncbi:collagen alpha-1(XV) chain isoform X1 [Tachysurus ichikawai]